MPWADVRWSLANGKPYAWFRTLVALCEPALTDSHASTPTNAALAARQVLGTGAIERHISEIYQRLGLNADQADREVAVTLAIRQGLVTRADLQMLPPKRRQ
jgi:hypothetical protein